MLGGMARTWGTRAQRRWRTRCYSGDAGAWGSSERWQTLEALAAPRQHSVGCATQDDKGLRGRDSPWPDKDADAMPDGCRCRADGYGAGKRESCSGECRRSDEGPGPATAAEATVPAGDAACIKLARGCPRMRPALVSCSLMPALYAATRSLSCRATVSDSAQGPRSRRWTHAHPVWAARAPAEALDAQPPTRLARAGVVVLLLVALLHGRRGGGSDHGCGVESG